MDEKRYILGLKSIPTLNNRLNRVVDHFRSAKAAWHGTLDDYIKMPGFDVGLAKEALKSRDDLDLDELLKRLADRKISVMSLDDPEYPDSLRRIFDPPLLLFYRGDLIKDYRVAVSVVGARGASPYGRSVAQEIAEELSNCGITVISGVARGIDSAAHAGALKGEGKTIGVLGSGHDVIYPPENKNLYSLIAEEGSLISEYLYNTPPLKWNFPARNRIISGLAQAVVVVEATEKSGALLTVDYALEQNREVFAVPGNVKSKLSRGPHNLLKAGACLVESGADIIEALGLIPVKKERVDAELAPLEREVLDFVGYEPRHIDEITVKLGLSTSDIAALLTKLEIMGHLKQDMGKNYLRIT
ncbi:MAG: DNA-processing protein DprA [Actinomycetota bacterium]|nr:DNA-processing protein DprA [Actinomycetota bacterium]